MSERSPEHSEGRGETPPSPHLRPEEPDSFEYAQALESLRRFTELDIAEIQNLEDLSARVSTVGGEIRRIVEIQGIFEEKIEKEEKTPALITKYSRTIRKLVGGDHEIVVRSEQDYSKITVYKSTEDRSTEEGGEKTRIAFVVRIPADRDLLMPPPPGQVRSSTALYGIDGRTGARYYPLSHPNNATINQEFAYLLQDGVKELLSVLPERTKVPDIFYNSYK